MNVEKRYIEHNWKGYEANCASDEMFDSVHEGLVHVTQNGPELSNCVDSHQKYDKESHKLDRECTAYAAPSDTEPSPPFHGELLCMQIHKLGHGISCPGYEEQQNWIE